MNRKSFLVVTAVMVATIVLQACSPAASSTAPSSGAGPSAAPVTLTLWHTYGLQANATVTNALAKPPLPPIPKLPPAT